MDMTATLMTPRVQAQNAIKEKVTVKGATPPEGNRQNGVCCLMNRLEWIARGKKNFCWDKDRETSHPTMEKGKEVNLEVNETGI